MSLTLIDRYGALRVEVVNAINQTNFEGMKKILDCLAEELYGEKASEENLQLHDDKFRDLTNITIIK